MSRALKKSPIADPDELNLVPIMNLVVCLIPIVLAGASLVKVGVVNVNAPRFGPLPTATQQTEMLDLAVAIGADGFHLSAANGAVGEWLGGQGATHVVPRVDGTLDMVGLYNALTVVKDRHPDESIVKLTADPQVPVRELITAMDVMRMRLNVDRLDSTEALRTASVRYHNGAPVPLWPDVVFSHAH